MSMTIPEEATVELKQDISTSITTTTAPTFPPPKTDKPRPHVCTTCQRSFARLEHLKRHERSHTKEKPFECPECSRAFARRDLLLRHQQKLHQTTTPASRPRNRRESTTGAGVSQSRVRKNSIAGTNGASAMRPRANTISHVDANTPHPMSLANLALARGMPTMHSRHPSLMDLPPHTSQNSYMGMANAIGNRNMAQGFGGLPKLDTHNTVVDMPGGLRTAPPMNMFNHGEFDFGSMMFGPSENTINPNALHYSDLPSSMAFDPMTPFSYGYQDIHMSQAVEDTYDFLPNFDQQMSFTHVSNEVAVDESSPSAMSTGDQSGISDLMVDGSNQPSTVTEGSSMWHPSVMPPPQLNGSFTMDSQGNVFPDLLNSAPLSPLPPPNPSANAYISTPPASMSSASPSLAPAFKASNITATDSGSGPETPNSMNGGGHTASPAATVTDATRLTILSALLMGPHAASLAARRVSSTTAPAPMPGQPYSLGADAISAGGLASTLPSVGELQRFLTAYLRYFHPHLPFLHVPTLSFDTLTSNPRSNTINGPACLLLSMTAIGALYELEHEKSKDVFEMAKRMIQIYLEERRKANVRKAGFRSGGMPERDTFADEATETPIWLVQAMLLNVVYGYNCGDKVAGDIASTHCATLVQLAQQAGLMGSTVLSEMVDTAMQPDPDDSVMSWSRWKDAEERKRTLFAIFNLPSLLMTAHKHAPALTNSEILLDLPCDEEFFNAENAAAFAAKGGATAAAHNRISFHDALSSLLGAEQQAELRNVAQAVSSIRTSTFGSLVLINALQNYICETRQRHRTRAWTGEELERLHRHVAAALVAWQAVWANDPHHSLERPNRYGKGPLSADAMPLLDVAYVRLYVNLAACKEKFWNRDWNGVATELARGSAAAQHPNGIVDVANAMIVAMADAAHGNSPGSATNGSVGSQGEAGQTSDRERSRREKVLRRAALYAAASLGTVDKLGVAFTDFTSRDLPLQSAMCAFDCVQVLAEWVATLQDRVGRHLGILGHVEIDMREVPACVLLEEEDTKMLAKIQEILNGAQVQIKIEPATSFANLESSLQMGEYTGLAAKLLRVTAFMLNRATVWPVTRLMAQCLETHAAHMKVRAEESINGLE